LLGTNLFEALQSGQCTNALPRSLLRQPDCIKTLHFQPEFRTGAKKMSQTQCSVAGDGTPQSVPWHSSNGNQQSPRFRDRRTFPPLETNPPLIVNADAVLPLRSPFGASKRLPCKVFERDRSVFLPLYHGLGGNWVVQGLDNFSAEAAFGWFSADRLGCDWGQNTRADTTGERPTAKSRWTLCKTLPIDNGRKSGRYSPRLGAQGCVYLRL
jgi:hypothetical protein